MSTRVLITEPQAQVAMDTLTAAGFDVDVAVGLSPEELLGAIRGASALVVRSATQVNAEVLEAGTELVVVGRAGIGLDNVDVGAATRKGVMGVNAPQSNILSAAEHTVALLISQARNVPQADFLTIHLPRTPETIGLIGRDLLAQAKPGIRIINVARGGIVDEEALYEAIVSGRGELVMGTRLVYPMEDDAMRFLNEAGNRTFSFLFTWLLNQRITDTLCGTKVLRRRHYDMIKAGRSYFGDFDPFGDFDLIFGAAKLNLRIVEIPVRYRARTYGTTQISRLRHGLLLLRMTLVAWRRLKAV
jgi:hypothetical protein